MAINLGKIWICACPDVFHGIFLNDWSFLFLEQGSQVWPSGRACRARVVRASHNSPQRHPVHHQPLGFRLLLPESVTHCPCLLLIPKPSPRPFSHPEQDQENHTNFKNNNRYSVPRDHHPILTVSAWDQLRPNSHNLPDRAPTDRVSGAHLLHLQDQGGDQSH